MQQQKLSPFSSLQEHSFLSLTTFRKNGQPVATPVWFAQEGEGDTLYVMTPQKTGKVKRIRSNAQVEVAPCSRGGTPLGAAHEAMGRILSDAGECARARHALTQKYGFQKRLFDLVLSLRRVGRVYLEITPM